MTAIHVSEDVKSALSGQRVLICGGMGFLGRNFVEAFAGLKTVDLQATYFNRSPPEIPGVRWVRADLRDAETVNRITHDIDLVVQCAATTSGAKDVIAAPHLHVTDNVVMNSLLFRAAHDNGVGQLFFPSCTVMYPSSDTALREEDFDANAPIYERYFGAGWTKVYLEKMAEFFSSLGATRFTVFRHSNLYGPHDKFDLEKSHVFGATIRKVLDAEDKIAVWGQGREVRDFIHADDMVRAALMVLATQTKAFDLFNLGGGTPVSIAELVQTVVEESGKNLEIEFDASKPTIDTRIFLNCDRIRDAVGWAPEIPLRDGIRKTLEWCRENG